MVDFWPRINIYRVAQQCCPGGNRPETPRRPSAGGLRIFWAKSLVIPAIYTKFVSHKLEFCIYGWNYQWFSPKNPETPCGGSLGGFRTISTGTTLLGHTVWSMIYIPPITFFGDQFYLVLILSYSFFVPKMKSPLRPFCVGGRRRRMPMDGPRTTTCRVVLWTTLSNPSLSQKYLPAATRSY